MNTTNPDPARIRILSDCIRLMILAMDKSETIRAAAVNCAQTILAEAGEPEKPSAEVIEIATRRPKEGGS